MKEITLDKSSFDDIKPMLKPYVKNHCNYCGVKITKDNFGLLARETTCCNNFICLTEALGDIDTMKRDYKPSRSTGDSNEKGSIQTGT